MGCFSKALDILPSAIVSRAFGAAADIRFPRSVQRCINGAFARLAHLNMNESERAADDYASLSELFTRKLKSGARVIAEADLVSPVDGRLSFAGPVADGMLIEAKGRAYSVPKLAGTADPDELEWLSDSYAFTIYLSPSNYHRIHAPMTGAVHRMSYTPGRLLPVNRLGYMMADDLLPSNERVTTFIRSDKGFRCAMVKVGATCVGKISVLYDEFTSNGTMLRAPFERALPGPQEIRAGDEIACFDLGSTVVLFVSREHFVPDAGLTLGMPVRMGDAIGNWAG